jgi:hypothetical protein
MTTSISRSILLGGLLAVTLSACGDKDGDGGTGTMDGGSADGGTSDGGTSDGGTETDGGSGDGGTEEEVFIEGGINGSVQVQLYREVDGVRENVAWADTPWVDAFPFGSIFVSAVQDSEKGGLIYRGDDTVREPSIEGDAYALVARLPGEGNVHLTATLDFNGDGVLSTSEPFGVHAQEVWVTEGETVDEKDIVVLVDYDAALAWWNSTGGGSCEDPVYISGDAILTSPWAGGDVAVLAYDTDGNGPYSFHSFEPTTSGGGAEGAFSVGFCGAVNDDLRILGAWDRNGNDLIDPADLWGALISKPEVDGNPLYVGDTDISGLEVQIPLGDGTYDLSIVPFVRLTGSVSYEDGRSFDELPAGSDIHAAAMLYRPSGDLLVDDFSSTAYSVSSWESADYAGQTELAYALWVPANTIVYLWGFVDHGPTPDGVVNTMDEIVGAGGAEIGGRVPTGTSDSSGLNIVLWDVPTAGE